MRGKQCGGVCVDRHRPAERVYTPAPAAPDQPPAGSCTRGAYVFASARELREPDCAPATCADCGAPLKPCGAAGDRCWPRAVRRAVAANEDASPDVLCWARWANAPLCWQNRDDSDAPSAVRSRFYKSSEIGDWTLERDDPNDLLARWRGAGLPDQEQVDAKTKRVEEDPPPQSRVRKLGFDRVLNDADLGPDADPACPAHIPGYIWHCSHNPSSKRQSWWALTWDRKHPETVSWAPYTCNSWRCPWPHGCADHERHVMYTRIKEAFWQAPPEECALIVLTLDSPFHGLDGQELDDLYKGLGRQHEMFRRRLRRLLKKTCSRCEQPRQKLKRGRVVERCACGEVLRNRPSAPLPPTLEDWGNEWVSVIEQHADGTPHINMLMHGVDFAAFLGKRIERRRKAGMRGKNARYMASVNDRRDSWDQALYELMIECGFGFASTAEPAESIDRIANYMCGTAANADKVAQRVSRSMLDSAAAGLAELRPLLTPHDHARLAAELSKERQKPVRAPPGFRRLRSGVGFLPPRKKDPDRTGTVLRRVRTSMGELVTRPLVPSSKEDLAVMQVFLADHDQRMLWAERRERATCAVREQVSTQRFDPAELERAGVYDAIDRQLAREAAELAEREAAALARAGPNARPPPPAELAERAQLERILSRVIARAAAYPE